LNKVIEWAFALTLVVMSQSTDATEVGSQANASDFPDELPGNSIDSPDPDIYIQYRKFPTVMARVLFLVHCWRRRDGYSKGSGSYCGLADPCLWFLSSIAAKTFIYFIS